MLMALLIATPAMAAVTLTVSQVGDTNEAIIGYAGAGTVEANIPAGFGLTITADNGKKINVCTPKITGESTQALPGYGIFPGTIDINSLGGVVSYGTPVEPNQLHNSGKSVLRSNQIIVALGALYSGSNNKPADTGELCRIKVSGLDCNVTVTPEVPFRGGVVARNASAINVSPVTKKLVKGVTICFTGPALELAQWNIVGQPACWCSSTNPRQCHGDAANDKQGKSNYWVSTNDLSILQAAWNKPYASLTTGQICADFDHFAQGKSSYRVSTNDLSILQANWNQANLPAANCP